MEKSAGAFRTISEVAEELKLPQHVLRFWETRFPQIRPLKRGGNRRFYRPDDVDLLSSIKTLLYDDGFTIKGVQRILKERGPRTVATLAQFPDVSDRAPSAADDGPEPMTESLEETDVSCDDAADISEDLAMSSGLFDRLRAVLFELSECRRILTAIRD